MGNVKECFAERLKKLRETAKLTQEQLAKELKVSRGAIGYYEKGERTPDIEFLNSVSTFFDLPVSYLLGYTENTNEKYKNLYESFGLTDKACKELEKNNSLGRIISNIITNDDFCGITELIESILEKYKSFNLLELDYVSFVFTSNLKDLIRDALLSELESRYADNEEPVRNIIHTLQSSPFHGIEIKEEKRLTQEIEKHYEESKIIKEK